MADATATPKVSADSGRTFSTLWNLWPYMWPSDRPDLKFRVVVAFAALIAAKVVAVLVPYSYKWVTDALTGQASAAVASSRFSIAAPVTLVLAYNVGRFVTHAASRRSATRSSRGSDCTRCGSSHSAPSCICTISRCAFIWSGGPAACRASSSAARRASRTSSATSS